MPYVLAAIPSALAAIGTGATAAAGAVGSAAGAVVGGLTSAATTVGGALAQGAGALGSALAQGVGAAGEAITQGVSALGQAIMGGGGIGEGASVAAEGLGQISEGAAALSGGMGGVPEATSGLQQAISGGTQFADAALTPGMISDVGPALPQGWSVPEMNAAIGPQATAQPPTMASVSPGQGSIRPSFTPVETPTSPSGGGFWNRFESFWKEAPGKVLNYVQDNYVPKNWEDLKDFAQGFGQDMQRTTEAIPPPRLYPTRSGGRERPGPLAFGPGYQGLIRSIVGGAPGA